MKTKNLCIFASILFISAVLLSGCATVPPGETLPTFSLNGISYLPLVSLCDSRAIKWDYDTFTQRLTLSKDAHKINLKVGESLVIVDGKATYLRHPVQLYQGTVAVPYRFKEQIIDTLFKEAYPRARYAPPVLKLKKIVIDAGHGGKDPGAVGKTGLREKDVNLDIAKRLSRLLESRGIEVVMTRSTDKFIPLSGRVQIANSSNAELFLSVHANANHVRSLKGFEAYYITPKVSDSKRALSTAKNTALNLDKTCFASNSLDLKTILWDMIFTSSRAESIELGQSICRSIDKNLDVKILGVKSANFEVLRGCRMPALLIEVGFLSNSDEERMLKNGYYRQKIAEGVMHGIEDYAQDYTIMEAAKR